MQPMMRKRFLLPWEIIQVLAQKKWREAAIAPMICHDSKRSSSTLKAGKKQTSGPKPNQLLVSVAFYGEDLESRYGKFAHHVNKTLVIPSRNWKRIEIPYDDLVPSTWTKQNVMNYPSRPDLQNVLNILFKFSSFKGDDGFRGSNTVWIDEITLE